MSFTDTFSFALGSPAEYLTYGWLVTLFVSGFVSSGYLIGLDEPARTLVSYNCRLLPNNNE